MGLALAIGIAIVPSISIALIAIEAVAAGRTDLLFQAAFDHRNIQALANSLIVASVAGFATTSLAIILALLLYRLGASGDRVIYAIAILPLFIPDYLFGLVGHALIEPQFGILHNIVPDDLLTSRGLALTTVAIAVTIKWLPPFLIVADAQIVSTSSNLVRQAALDFYRWRDVIRFVIGPRLFRLVPLLALLTFLLAFRAQELATELTSKGSGFQAEMWSDWNYRTIYEFSDLTSASAAALLTLTILIFVIDMFRRIATKAELDR